MDEGVLDLPNSIDFPLDEEAEEELARHPVASIRSEIERSVLRHGTVATGSPVGPHGWGASEPLMIDTVQSPAHGLAAPSTLRVLRIALPVSIVDT